MSRVAGCSTAAGVGAVSGVGVGVGVGVGAGVPAGAGAGAGARALVSDAPAYPRSIPVKRIATTLLAMLACAMMLVLSLPLPGSAAETGAQAAGQDGIAATTTEAETAGRQVVLIGASGIRWVDVNQESTPGIATFAQASAVGNLIVRNVRTSTCPIDGWLSLSAGNRAGDSINGAGRPCRYIEEPSLADGLESSTDAQVPNWTEFKDSVSSQKYNAALGSTAAVLQNANVTASAIGPGAAVALSNADGTVDATYYPRPAEARLIQTQVALALKEETTNPKLLVVDAGHVRVSRSAKDVDSVLAAQLKQVDTRVEATLRSVYANDPHLKNTTIILASLADPMGTPRISILAMAGVGVEGNFLTSPSTRQSGYNQATDLPTTIFSLLGVDYSSHRSSFVGSTIGYEMIAGSGTDRIDSLIDEEAHVLAARPLVGSYFLFYCIANVALFCFVAYIFGGRFLRHIARSSSWMALNTRHMLVACEVAGIALASLPISTVLANLVPWWRTSAPTLTLIALIIAIIAVIVYVAMLPPWRSWRFGPMAVVSLVTFIVLAIDISTGATMQIASLMGVQPMVGGRFYGFNNHAFILFAVSSLLLAGALANELVVRGRRKTAFFAVSGIGIFALLLDGAPSLGADFGGPPALFPAFAFLALKALGTKLNFRKILAIGVGAVLVVGSFAVADWLRPEDKRTHLGRFVDTIIDGGFFDVVGRKIAASISTFSNPLSFVAIAAALVLVVVLGRPLSLAARNRSTTAPYQWLTKGVPLKQMSVDTPMFIPAITAVLVAIVIGTMVNDSSVVILGIGLATLVPLLVATYARWILEINRTRGISHALPPALAAPAN